MKTKYRHFFSLIAFTVISLTQVPICKADKAYHLLKEIPIGGDGGWDYLSVDEIERRLYVTHENRIAVIDLIKERVISQITNTPGVHGFALAPRFQRGFASNGDEAKLSIIDLRSLKTISKLNTGKSPDAVLYEPVRATIYVFNGGNHSATVFEADDGDFLTTIQLPGKPEFAAAEPKAARVYCNIEDKNEVVAIDIRTHKIVNHWPIAPGEAASGMAIDLEHHRLFLGCSNKLMVMMDSSNGKVVGTVPIGEGVDAVAFDPSTQLAFSSNGEGTVTIAHEESPEKLTVAQTLKTQPGARTMALDPKTHKIYLATANFESPPKGSEAARKRPKIVPNSFKVLIYGME